MNEKTPHCHLVPAFQRHVALDSAAAARHLTATWLAIDAALRGVIGPQGVAALYSRSVSLTARRRPWMAAACDNQVATLGLAALQSEMALQPLAEAQAAAAALLQVFEDLLCSLIGSALAERLLRPVWEVTGAEPPVEETEAC